VALVLANETGHRIGAIRKLWWTDVDFDRRTIVWRAENEKTGYEHITPLSEEALEALSYARAQDAGCGRCRPVLPADKDPSRPINEWVMRDLWGKAEARAGLEPKYGRGWHSIRRKFATDLMQEPLSVLCGLGGWKDFETVLKCYQQPDQAALRAALTRRKELHEEPQQAQRKGPTGRLRLVK